MKHKWKYIKLLLLSGLLVFLYSFSKERNNNRTLNNIEVVFLDENDPFITVNAVNKLLIQNNDSLTGIVKETLDLKEMEYRLLKNPMIRDAEVFVTVEGTLGAKIIQRNPVGRVVASQDYYLDDEGKRMPLSPVHTARVPLITGISNTAFTEVTPLLLKIDEDAFMKKSVVGLHVNKNGTVELQLRKNEFKVLFGKPEAIEKKFQKFKAFYQKTKEDSTFAGYSHINLEFGDQVVATKK